MALVLFSPADLTSATSHSPFVVSSPQDPALLPAWHVFDGGATGYGQESYALPLVIKLDCGAGNTHLLDTYAILNAMYPLDAPSAWTVEGSNDDSTYDALDSRSGETGWGAYERRQYQCATRTTAYRYFRFTFTANGGDAVWLLIRQLYLYEFVASTTGGGGAGSGGTGGGTSGGGGTGSSGPGRWKVISPTALIITCTQATFPTLDTTQAGRFIFVSDYRHLIFWDGVTFSFVGDDPGRIEGFAVDPGAGWHLCDGSTVTYLKADGTTGSIMLDDLVSNPSYPKFGGTVTGVVAATPAVITGDTADASTGDSVSATSSSIAAGDGSSGSGTFLDGVSLSDPGHHHGAGTLVNDDTSEPQHKVLRPFFRL